LFQWSKYGYTAQISDSTFHRFCLTLSHFENAITSWILGFSLCISARLYHKGCRTQWNNPCRSSSLDEIVARGRAPRMREPARWSWRGPTYSVARVLVGHVARPARQGREPRALRKTGRANTVHAGRELGRKWIRPSGI
jgi:hypothetical protein